MSQNNEVLTAFKSLFGQGINLGNYTAVPNSAWFTIQQQLENQLVTKDQTIKKLEEEVNKLKTIPTTKPK